MRVGLQDISRINFFGEADRTSFGTNFELPVVVVLDELRISSYELDGGSAKELSSRVVVVSLISASAGLLLAEKVYDGGDRDVSSSQDKVFTLDWLCSGHGADTGKRIVDGKNGIMTVDDYFLVVPVRQLLLRKKNRALEMT